MEKINIAELLKDCPQGMELDCTMFEDCTFLDVDEKANNYVIRITTPCGIKYLDKYGRYVADYKAKCVIFPKGKTTWEGFVPPCNFKDGDIVSIILGGRLWYGIYKKEHDQDLYCHVSYSTVTESLYHSDTNNLCSVNNITDIRLATEEEKERLFQVIKNNGYRWNAETKTLEELVEPKFKVWDKIRHKDDETVITITGIKDDYYFIQFYNVRRNDYQNEKVSFKDQDQYELVPNKFDIATLKPFSEVLVRYDNDNPWMTAHFSHYMKDVEWECPYFASGACFKQCIPYKGNEHLRGTTNDCDDFYKNWK